MAKNTIKNISGRAYYLVTTLIALAIVILVNIIFSYVDFRVDFTEDQRYSLTETTIDYLESDTTIYDKLLFKIYLDGDLPAEIRRLKVAVHDKLDEFRYYAGDKIQYQFINPNKGSEAAQKALQEKIFDKGAGIRPVTITYQSNGSAKMVKVWPGAVVSYQGEIVDRIRFMEGGRFRLDEQLDKVVTSAINNLEYDFMQVIAKATRKHKKTLAFIHGQGELGVPYTQGARRTIEDEYIIKDVKINGALNSLDKFDGIIITDPTEKFSDKDLFIIDQYLMQGGNIMVFNCPLKVNNDSIRVHGKTHSVRKKTGISNLLFEYGIKVNEDLVVDANYDRFIMPGLPKGYVNWYYYVYALGTDHPISNMIRPVKLPYCSSLQFVKTDNKTNPSVILSSSANSKSYGTVPIVSIGVERVYGEHPIFQNDPRDKSNRLMLGAIVEGKFESAFRNRIVSAYADNPNASFIEASKQPGKVMVVGNGTFFKNSYYDSVYVPETNNYRYIPRLPRGREIDELLNGRPMGNFDFFENCVDYMLGEKTLLSIRSRVIKFHPLDELKVSQDANFYKVINIVVPVLFILVLATIVLFIRRYKYKK